MTHYDFISDMLTCQDDTISHPGAAPIALGIFFNFFKFPIDFTLILAYNKTIKKREVH